MKILVTDKSKINESWAELRASSPLFSYSLMFQRKSERNLFADILLFGMELDHITAHASEPMIALIRLAWWEEQLVKTGDQLPPLMHRLHDHIKIGACCCDDLLTLLGLWQEQLASDIDNNLDSRAECWAGLLTYLTQLSGYRDMPMAKKIGRAVYTSRMEGRCDELASARDIWQIYGRGCEYLIIMAYLARNGAKTDITADPLLIFKVLKQVLLKPSS